MVPPIQGSEFMKLTSRFAIRTAARVIAAGARTLFATVKTDVHMRTPDTCAYYDTGSQRYLYCLWHDAIMGVIFGGKSIDMAGLVSQHEDGSYVADAMECVNLKPIRGSSRRGGAAALRQMIDAAAKYHIAIATDGPRGPRHVVKDGIIFLAAQSGRAILPVGVSAARAWRPRGRWTDMLVPRPFSRMVIAIGAPVFIPQDVSRDEITSWKQKLQALMEEMNVEADRIAGVAPVIHRPFRAELKIHRAA
jgi:lysophospholipid acyltransferase (LPLAT)-like uncharacterized protein